jgi:hypothetical protein
MPALFTSTSTPPKRSRAASSSRHQRDAVGLAERGGRPRELLLVAPVQHDAGAFVQEAAGDCEADAAAGAGDHDSIGARGHEGSPSGRAEGSLRRDPRTRKW